MNHKGLPLRTGKVETGFWAIRDFLVNIFIVETEIGIVCFDCGWHSQKVSKELKKIGFSSQDVKAIFLTHTHKDHIGAISIFNTAKIYLNALEKEIIYNRTKNGVIKETSAIQGVEHSLYWLKDRETLFFGKTSVTTVFCPGHTSGSTSYIVNKNLLFTGDAAWYFFGATTFPFFLNKNNRQAKRSLELLINCGHDLKFVTSHSGIFSLKG